MKITMLTWALLLLWLIYFISPIDVLPDFIARPLGWLDDMIVGYFLWRLRNSYKNFWTQSGDGTQEANSSKHSSQKQKASDAQSENSEAFNPYEVLGVSPGASKEQIDKSYKALVNKYHPDKVSHLGEEFQKIAHEKMIEIQRAYSALKC